MRLELSLANYTLMSDHIPGVISRQIRWSYNYADKAPRQLRKHTRYAETSACLHHAAALHTLLNGSCLGNGGHASYSLSLRDLWGLHFLHSANR